MMLCKPNPALSYCEEIHQSRKGWGRAKRRGEARARTYNIDIIGRPILGWSLEKLRLQAEAVKKSGDLPDPTPHLFNIIP